VPFQFSEFELIKLHTAWLAYKKLDSPEFISNFKILWDSVLKENEALISKYVNNFNLREVGKVGLTLSPNTTFAFSFIDRAYVLNVWDFLFCYFDKDASLFFRPSFFLINELFHEFAHFKFWRDHNMFEKDLNEKKKFNLEHGKEDEIYAHKEEEKLLKKLGLTVPVFFEQKLFRILSWTMEGTPNCQGALGELSARRTVKKRLKELHDNRVKLESSLTIENYNFKMRTQKAKNNNVLAKALKLNDLDQQSQIVWMDL
jgi:hypothetical protein